MTANIAVDDATPENGCLEVVPKSHKMDVVFQEGGKIHPDWEAVHEWVPVPLHPGKSVFSLWWMDVDLGSGDILFFGSHLAHRSGPNRTEKSRIMVYATYACETDGKYLREKYYEHRRIAFPPDHGRLRCADIGC